MPEAGALSSSKGSFSDKPPPLCAVPAGWYPDDRPPCNTTYFHDESFQGVFDKQPKLLRDYFVAASAIKLAHEAARNCKM
jgi:hypothetical protein